MLSNKMTFSLMSLITIIALAFVAPTAMGADFSTDITQIGSLTYRLTDANALDTTVINIDLEIEFGQDVGAIIGNAGATDPNVAATAFDKLGAEVALDNVAVTELDANAFTQRTARKRQIRIAVTPAPVTTPAATIPPTGIITKIVVSIPQFEALDPSIDADDNMSTAKFHTINAVQPVSRNTDRPMVVSIQRLNPVSQAVVSAFAEAKVTGAFDVRIVLTEAGHEWTNDKIGDRIKVDGGTASNLVVGVPFERIGTAGSTLRPHPAEGGYGYANDFAAALGVGQNTPERDTDHVPATTGPDNMYHQYRVTITPHRRVDTVKVSVKDFHDNASPFPNTYKAFDIDNKPNGRERLTLDVATDLSALGAGFMVYLPHADKPFITYANSEAGHLIIAKNKAGSGIDTSEQADAAAKTKVENVKHKQTPAQLLYNVRAASSLPNLETFLANNGTIDLVSYDADHTAGAYISEIMWGTDASQSEDATNSQWIEIANGKSAAIEIKDKKWALWFYQAHETPRASYVKDDGTAGVLIDRVGTKTFAGTIIAPATTGTTADAYWSIAGKGQSGRSGVDAGIADVAAIAPIQKLASMYRVMVPDTSVGATAGAMVPGDGTVAASWMQSGPPSVNFMLGLEGKYDASPGSTRVISPAEAAATAAAAKAKADAAAAAAAAAADTSVSMPKVGQIYISELMVAGGGTLPQWIEISNGSRSEEVNLSGWTLTVNNAAADADVSVSSITFTIPEGTKIDRSRQSDTPSTILVVTEQGRNNLSGAMASGQVLNLWDSNQTELILGGITKRRYSLLSGMAFQITLAPPVPIVVPAAATPAPTTAAGIAAKKAADAAKKAADAQEAAERADATDTVGNLGADGAAAWALPMDDSGARSSLIRKHVQVSVGPAEPEDGTMMDSWGLASETSFAQVTHIRAASYYGAANDVGTPGFRAGGALPVELSHFRPARQETGAVVITWSTQSELNNAGFFIKRSQQKDGEFKVINAAMVPGAGTTSEKQFYTFTDTTAQPNVVYYYQIEDVSLDGNRQTLTRGIRLKGHIGAAGKLTSTWGELKTSNE